MRAFLLRPFHYFISYSHKDAGFAKDLRKWLSETAGLRTWFDEVELRSGERVQADIATSISQCQGIVLVLSKNSLASKFVQDEIDQALAEKKENSRFQIVLLRLDDCDIAGQWKSVRHLKWHELGTPTGPKLGLHAAADMLCRLYAYEGWQVRQGELKEVYVSRGWRKPEEAFADEICRHLAVHGLRLVGDLPDQTQDDPNRIAGIMRGCWGHVLILPRRTSAGGASVAYKYFLQESEISTKLGVPRVVLCERECELPPTLAKDAVVVSPEMLGGEPPAGSNALRDHIYDFVENLVKPQREVHAFFASEYRGNEERNALARTIVEATGTLPCYWGKDYRGTSIQNTIAQAIMSARFLVADLTSTDQGRTTSTGQSRVNVNACIEAAIAWGADVRILCVAAANPQSADGSQEGKTKHVPFMFRSFQLDLYSDSVSTLGPGVEFLGAIHKAVHEDRRRFGRRVINYELGA